MRLALVFSLTGSAREEFPKVLKEYFRCDHWERCCVCASAPMIPAFARHPFPAGPADRDPIRGGTMKSAIDDNADMTMLTTDAAPRCGEVLAPIPGERWECVAVAGHELRDHVADDGTQW
jgi:hypothetical protein